jgi:hypothetical protein
MRVYLIDLRKGDREQVVDWDYPCDQLGGKEGQTLDYGGLPSTASPILIAASMRASSMTRD